MRNFYLAILLFIVPGLAAAQNDRSDTWDVSVSAIFQDSKSIGGEGASSLALKSEVGFGVNFAYNFTSKLALGMDLEFLRPGYTATLVDENAVLPDVVIRQNMSQVNTRFKGNFNLLDGPFTPFLEGGFGWSYFDSNVADGPPVTGCWWHPYWGYICDNFYRTFNDTLFSYGAGAGLRYEMLGGLILKASYNYWEMDGLGKAEDSAFEAIRIEFGMAF